MLILELAQQCYYQPREHQPGAAEIADNNVDWWRTRINRDQIKGEQTILSCP